MQLPGLRLPTLEECMQEESVLEVERRAEVVLRLSTPETPSSQVALGAVKKPAQATVKIVKKPRTPVMTAKKRRRMAGKQPLSILG